MVRGYHAEWHFIWNLALASSAAAVAPAAADAQTISFNIPSSDLATALRAYSRQSGQQILFSEDAVRKFRSPVLTGPYLPGRALKMLLSGSRLDARRGSGNVWIVGSAESIRPMPIAAVHMVPQPIQSTPTTAGPPAAPDAAAVADIVVTANKREQSINDVGLSVAAYSASELTRRGINDIQDLARTTPALQYTPSPNNTPIFTIRGIGFVESSLPSYPTVSVSLDQLPLPFPALTALTAFDLERVEVLKGPQGTLFGQNTTGGAINYVAAKPTDHLTAGASLTYGRFNRIEAEGFVSGPLTDKLSARLAARITRMDDWQKSISRPGDTQGKVRDYAGRLLLDFTPSDRTRLELNLNAWQDKSDPIAAQYGGIGVPQVASALDPRLTNPTVPNYQRIAPDNARYADWTAATPQFANNRFKQAALRADVGITDNLTVTSITSYIDYKTRAWTDGDGTALVIGDVPQVGAIKSFSQELRLANDPASTFRWVVGGNFSRDKVFDEVHSIFYDQSAGRANGIGDSKISTSQTMKNYAGFGNIEYDILPTVTLKGGVRYTEADRVAYNCLQGADNGRTAAFHAAARDRILGLPPGTTKIPEGVCDTIDYTAPGSPVTITPFRQVLKEHNVSWQAGVNYKPARRILLYANIAKGYKAGSIPRIGATTTLAFRSVKQEQVMAYEAGFKADLIRHLLNVTGAAYYYDYKDKQLRAKIIPPQPSPFRTLESLDNIPKSRIWGTELEARLYPARGLSISGAAAYTNAKIKRYDGVSAAGLAAVFDGARIPFAPKWQYSASADYELDTGDLKPFLGGTVNYRSDTPTIIGGERRLETVGYPTSGTKPFLSKSYTLVDLRAGVEAPDGRWRLTVFGKNVFNKYYTTNLFSVFETIIRYPGMPVTYGVTLAWKLK